MKEIPDSMQWEIQTVFLLIIKILQQFSSTIRTKEGKGSSKIDRSYADIDLLDVKKFSDRVIDRAVLSKDPQKYEPGKYVDDT